MVTIIRGFFNHPGALLEFPYDLSVEFYVGMPSHCFLGQPRFQIWNVHTPQGTIVDDPNGLGKQKNSHLTTSAIEAGATVASITRKMCP